MKTLVPAYYPGFSCIAGACRHSCCIGWEIDIDDTALAYYKALPGEIGTRLRENIIEEDGTASFRLCGAEEHCPFLNGDGLCELILTLGEEALCQICTDHPRFVSEFSDHTELGLGLCCEAAAKRILSFAEPFSLIQLGDDGEVPTVPDAEETALLSLRDAVLACLCDRSLSIGTRIASAARLCAADTVPFSVSYWSTFLSSLEILDPAWRSALAALTTPAEQALLPDLAAEQLLVYFVYRHFPKIREGISASALFSFCRLMLVLTQTLYAHAADRHFDTLCDLVRMLSSELEYSEDNLYAILDALEDGQGY